MRNRTSGPRNTILVSTYEKLEEYLLAFSKGHLNLLIIIGSGGLAKSRTVRSILGAEACWIEGNATPFGMYLKLYHHRDQFVVIDDVDSLYADQSGVRLLKTLCQTEREKTVSWQSGARSLQRERVPREFTTRSRVVIVTNDWKTLNRNVAALQDRGHVICFRPSARDVHEKTREWFFDADLLAWFERQIPYIKEPSMRLYVRALELKRAGMDWTEVIPISPTNRRAKLVSELKADLSFSTEEARARAFQSRGGGCRATYFNYARIARVES